MARPRRQEERRADLVEAALTAVSEHGLRSLSLADVAEKAGLTRGAILYYYEDLDALLVEAHRAGLERFCDHRDAVVAAIAEPQLQLAAAIREGLPSGPDDALMRLLYEFDVLAGTSKLHDDLVEKMYLRQLATYTAILERGTASGAFAPRLDVATLAMNLVALEDAYGLHIVAGNSLITVESAEAAMTAAAAGLGAPTRV
ncbi:TetR/AcrR family transcriptional regulator [Leifsonia sp. NPDC102414]|jgi:DNA-binding transcriptional regulator YbjK|uniref:TetR/AcrR family transcriptional regulator n=1 Tax=Leifsonia sp. NPDC102414 TaxID=3364124 RepID=UPI003801D4AB